MSTAIHCDTTLAQIETRRRAERGNRARTGVEKMRPHGVAFEIRLPIAELGVFRDLHCCTCDAVQMGGKHGMATPYTT